MLHLATPTVLIFLFQCQQLVADTVTYQSLEGLQLVRKLEDFYCRKQGKVGSIANEAEARVCIQGLTASGETSDGICQTNLMNSCICPDCVVCCLGPQANSPGPICQDISNYRINETRAMQWTRQSLIEGELCNKEEIRQKKGFTGWKLCNGEVENGKVCDLYRKDNVEIPLVCKDGACQTLDCALFDTQAEGDVERCDCPSKYALHRVCCRYRRPTATTTTRECKPYYDFLLNHTVRADQLTTVESQQDCSEANQCTCSVESGTECHKCCAGSSSGDTCRSIFNSAGSVTSRSRFLRPTGTSCAYGTGFCTESGQCQDVAEFCQRGENRGQVCGRKHRCDGFGSCSHVCGSENNECICGEPDECKVCCRGAANHSQCTSVYDPRYPNALLRGANTPCQGNKGRCSDLGRCRLTAQKRSIADNAGDGINGMTMLLVPLFMTFCYFQFFVLGTIDFGLLI